jgi:hypothetical protein
MQQNLWSGLESTGGIVGYPLDQLYEEVAYIAYYFHWPLQQILELEHEERRKWIEEIANINRKLTEATLKV